MSTIDLKRCQVYLRDGYSKNGLSDSTAAQSIGAHSIAVDTFTGAVETGIFVHFAGDDTRYTVTAHTETLGNTTQIVITPGLVAALANNTVVSTGPHSLALNNGEGTITFSEKKPRQYILNRGALSEVRNADEVPVDWALDINYEFLESESGATTPTAREVINQIGAASAWVTSDPDTCKPYSIDIVIEYDPQCDSIDKEVVTIPYARHEQFDADLKAGTLKCSGKSNVTLVDVERTDTF